MAQLPLRASTAVRRRPAGRPRWYRSGVLAAVRDGGDTLCRGL